MNYEFIFTTYPNVVLVVKKLPANAGIIGDTEFSPWAGKIPWRRAWEPTPVFLPGEFHGQRNLAGYSPWVAESDTTEHTYIATTLYRINVYNSFLLLLYKKKSNFSFPEKTNKQNK